MTFGYMSLRDSFRGLYRLCFCGCKYLIKCIKRNGRLAKFKKGHSTGGRRGENNSNYKNGKYSDNYLRIIVNGKNIKKHIHIFQEYIQCCMLPWGDVHHKDGDKFNNEITNLQGIMHNQHAIISNKKDMSGRFCKICGGKTKYNKSRKGTLCESWQGNEIDGWTCKNCYMKQLYYKNKNGKERPQNTT